MNKVILVGRMAKDPEVRVTTAGKKVASFTIAVDDGKRDGEKQSQFFNCTAWEKLAELVEMYVAKGTRVGVAGRLQNRSWDKPDGTKGYATDVVVTELDILSTKAESEAMKSSDGDEKPASASKPAAAKPSKKAKDEDEDDELPEIDVDKLNIQMPF